MGHLKCETFKICVAYSTSEDHTIRRICFPKRVFGSPFFNWPLRVYGLTKNKHFKQPSCSYANK